MKKKTRRCPYCDSKVSYIRSLTEISSGEHLCRECSRYSSITYDKKIYISAGLLLLIAVILAAVMFFSDFSKHILLKFIVTIIPFVVFFFMIPLYYRLNSIKSEAARPAVKIKKRSESKEKTKYIKYNAGNEQAEERIEVSSNGSFKEKFHKFVKTYIVVDDDEDESEIKSAKNEKTQKKEKENKKQYNDEFGNFDDDVIIEDSYDDNTEENVQIENIDIDNEYVDDDENKHLVEDSIDEDEDDIFVIEDNSEDRRAFKRPKSDTAVHKKIEEKISEKKSVPVKTEEKPIDTNANREITNEVPVPVYHKLTKTNKVDFIYFVFVNDVIRYENMKDIEPEIDEDEQENEEILNFFDSEPSAEEEEEFGGKNANKVEYKFGEKEEYEQQADEEYVEPDYETGSAEEKDETQDELEDDYVEFEYVPEKENVIDVAKSADKPVKEAFSESADDEEDVVAETPDIISGNTEAEDDQLEFDFGDEDDDAKSVSPSDILSYEEELEVTGDIDSIEVITQEDVSEDDSKADKKLIPVITPAVLEDEYNSDDEPIEFGKQFDEIFDFVPNNSKSDLSEKSDITENGMKLVEVSGSDDQAERNDEKHPDIDEEKHIEDEADTEEELDNTSEEDEELFDENDEEPIEGAVEYIPEEKSLEKTRVFAKIEPENDYVVDYSEDKEEQASDNENYDDLFEEDDDDEEIDFSGYQTSSYTEEEPEDEHESSETDEQTETSKTVINEEPVKAKPSKYEKKFPKAAQAAAAMSQKKPVKESAVTDSTEKEKPVQKKPAQKKPAQKKKNKSKGFFSAIKEKIVEATEEERNEAFEQEEEARRLADKEARRKAKEKAKAEKEKINSQNSKKKSKR